MTKLKMIVSQGNGGVIGDKNGLPWDIPEDVERFKTAVTNKTVIVGRKTFVDLPATIKDKLSECSIIVFTNNQKLLDRNNDPARDSKIVYCNSVSDVVSGKVAKDNYFPNDMIVMGGSEIYNEFLPHVTEILMTSIFAKIDEPTAIFPIIDRAVWNRVDVTDILVSELHDSHGGKQRFVFSRYVRNRTG